MFLRFDSFVIYSSSFPAKGFSSKFLFLVCPMGVVSSSSSTSPMSNDEGCSLREEQ